MKYKDNGIFFKTNSAYGEETVNLQLLDKGLMKCKETKLALKRTDGIEENAITLLI